MIAKMDELEVAVKARIDEEMYVDREWQAIKGAKL